MKTKLFYFTGTGNSLVAARALAKELGDTEVISIPQVINTNLATDAERVGIVFPVYIWGMPLIVARFAEQLQVKPGTYLFGVATYGGFPAGTLLQLSDIFKKRNLEFAAGFGVHMPGNYTPLYGAHPVETQNKMFMKADIKLKQIAAEIKTNKKGIIEKNNFIINFLFSSFLYNSSYKQIPQMDKGFWADEKCNNCGICVKVCPVKNIKLENSKPQWQHKCEQCLACLQWCPTEAIQFGKNTAKRKRYHHPEVKIDDLIIK